jgi:ABC-type transporter Mla subunit MlaD
MKNPNGPSIEEKECWADALADEEQAERKGMNNPDGPSKQEQEAWACLKSLASERNSMNKSKEIHDAINFVLTRLTGSPESVAAAMQQTLLILQEMNRRMDEIESASKRAGDVASCLANGIKPD